MIDRSARFNERALCLERFAMPARSVVFLLLAVILVAGAFTVSRCSGSRSASSAAEAAQSAPASAATLSSDPILIRVRVMLLTHAGAGTPEGTRLLALARDVAGGVITPEQLAPFDIDFGTLAGAGQASIVSSPAAMIGSGQQASIGVGQIGVAPASAFNLDLDLLATCFSDGLVRGTYTLQVSQQTGAVEMKLAEFGLPVGDRGAITIDAPAASGETLLGLRELPRSSDLGSAIILLIAPQIVPGSAAPASGNPSPSLETPADAPAEPADTPVEHDG